MRTASYSGVGIGILNAATPMTNDNREKTRSDRDAPSESPNLPETNAPKAKKPKTERESALIVRPRTQSGVRSWNVLDNVDKPRPEHSRQQHADER